MWAAYLSVARFYDDQKWEKLVARRQRSETQNERSVLRTGTQIARRRLRKVSAAPKSAVLFAQCAVLVYVPWPPFETHMQAKL